MRILAFAPLLLLALFGGCGSKPDGEIEKSAFLQPYVKQLKTSTSPADLNRIRTMAKSELILLHHGYGTGIRNKWLHGRGDPQLLRFFHDNGIDEPDDMSMCMIYALWDDLNRSLSPAERASIDAKRALVARKRTTYARLESECKAQLFAAQSEFERCDKAYGHPSKDPLSRKPFFKLLVERSGRVREVVFFKGASPELKKCLEAPLQRFRFSAFTDDEVVTLYILEFPDCRVAERDDLHQ